MPAAELPTSVGLIELHALSYTEGRAVGSALIDFEAKRLIERRLDLVRGYIHEDLDTVIDRMMRRSFQCFKCNFGSESYNNYPRLLLPIPGMRPGMDFAEAQIEDSNVVITR